VYVDRIVLCAQEEVGVGAEMRQDAERKEEDERKLHGDGKLARGLRRSTVR